MLRVGEGIHVEEGIRKAFDCTEDCAVNSRTEMQDEKEYYQNAMEVVMALLALAMA